MTFAEPPMRHLDPLRHVEAGVLEVAYYEAGPSGGPVVMLLHGFPYDIHSYVEVAPMLAAQGCRVIVPYLRGYGPTRFRDAATPRSGEQAAIGADLMALMDALAIPRAVVAGYDWGGRAACIGGSIVAGALYRTGLGQWLSDPGHRACHAAGACGARGSALVSILLPARARSRRARGRPARHRAHLVEAMVAELAFRGRDLRAGCGRPRKSRLRRRRDPQLPASFRAGGGRSALCRSAAPARRTAANHGARDHAGWRRRRRRTGDGWQRAGRAFADRRAHRVVPRAGHNLPQEAPEAFATAVMELIGN